MVDPVIPAPPSPRSRLFFALFPDADVADAVVALADAARSRLGLRGRVMPAAHLHVTVNYLGTFDSLRPDVVGAARVAADRLASPPVPIGFDTLASFDSRRRLYPLVLRGGDNAPVRALNRALTAALLDTRAIATAEPYEPHLTLLRDRTLVAAEAIAPVRWIARELVLVHIHVGQGRHELLARWPLDA